MTFSNAQVDLESLPRFQDVEYANLSPRYAKLVRSIAWSFVAAVALVAAVLLVMTPPLRAFVASVAGIPFVSLFVGLLGFIAWFPHKAAGVIRYAVREHDVIVRTGVFWRQDTIQPLRRIQHVEQAQGPLDKRAGLYTLKLYSAGTGQATFSIPGLDARTAAKLKRFLLTRRDDADAEPE
jgi:membrane protein YdbS with pleckstrin-like domain